MDATSLRANLADQNDPTPGPKRLGQLRVEATGQGGDIVVNGLHAVDAALGLQPISNGTIVVVPEPDKLVQLAVGLLFLFVVSRLPASGGLPLIS